MHGLMIECWSSIKNAFESELCHFLCDFEQIVLPLWSLGGTSV